LYRFPERVVDMRLPDSSQVLAETSAGNTIPPLPPNVAAYRATSAHANQISENRLLKRITDWTDRRPNYYKIFTIYTPKYTKAHCDQNKDPLVQTYCAWTKAGSTKHNQII